MESNNTMPRDIHAEMLKEQQDIIIARLAFATFGDDAIKAEYSEYHQRAQILFARDKDYRDHREIARQKENVRKRLANWSKGWQAQGRKK
jgi:hypothetical protein